MKNQMTLNFSLAAVLSAAVATAALRAAARRQQARSMPGTEPAPVTVTVGESRLRSAVTTGTQGGVAHKTARPPSLPGRPASVVEQMQHVFHELHADGRNALCAVCDSQYLPA
jgi:alkanesulfonate monooxygenase SsuD/methylene tetrahydromethanopterin reductase-like flavin-dependent oxidoreductase (luciferase family)